MQYEFNVMGMSCSACERHVKEATSKVKGVNKVEVFLLQNKMNVFCENFTSKEAIIKAVEQAGYQITLNTENTPVEPLVLRNEKKPIFYSFLFLLFLMIFSIGFDNKMPFLSSPNEQLLVGKVFSFFLLVPILIIQKELLKKGFLGLYKLAPTMDSLVALGVLACFVTGIFSFVNLNSDLYFESAGMILCFVSLGRFFEKKAKKSLQKALEALHSLVPQIITVIRQGKEENVSIQELRKTDRVVLRAGEQIPVDGKVALGEGEVDEASLTGEGFPVEKEENSLVYAGTVLLSGYLEVEIAKVGKDTLLGNIIKLVENAESTKAPIARLADKISAIFVPTILGLAFITFLVWFLMGYDSSFCVMMGISVLVVSCPCALGLATPTAMVVGIGEGAKKGVVFKSAQAIENIEKITSVVWDKTGTLTTGKMVVDKLIPVEGYSELELLTLAANIEQVSKHPFASAILQLASDKKIQLEKVISQNLINGRGLVVDYGKGESLAGNYKLFQARNISVPSYESLLNQATQQGCSLILFAQEGTYMGCIFLKDSLRESAKDAVSFLGQNKIKNILLTGDHTQIANALASQVGIKEVYAEVLPNQKEQLIRSLQAKGEKVLMIGDGINDSPALACADVGVSVASGTDVAVNVADIILVNSDLNKIKDIFLLGKRVMRHVKQNLFWAFFYNILLIPLAAGVFYPLGWKLSPMFAAIAMSFSSVCVVTNALRIRSYENNSKELIKMKKILQVEGMMCAHCARHVEEGLLMVKGVKTVKVELAKKQAIVEVEGNVSDELLVKAVQQAGYQAKIAK